MTRTHSPDLETFENAVDLRFTLYNSLFLSLPFDEIEKTGALLTLFGRKCDAGFEAGRTVPEIVESFFIDNTSRVTEKERLDLLFRFVQYAERQVVLFDAVEDASFSRLHDLRGIGTLKHLMNAVRRSGKDEGLRRRLTEFGIRLVLTAHPTQFYPGAVLGIINDLADAIEDDDTPEVKLLLQQLGRTPFFKKEKPTPYDEALALIWYLENVFYPAIGEIIKTVREHLPTDAPDISRLIRMGFWSGGDRDGNPYVTVATTRRVARELRNAALRCYHRDLKQLRRRLTFSGIESLLAELENVVYQNAFRGEESLTSAKLLESLERIRAEIATRHNGLFEHMVIDLITKVRIFGLSMASLDIRQDSSVHTRICGLLADKGVLPYDYEELGEDAKIDALLGISERLNADEFADDLAADTFETIEAIAGIQRMNGDEACARYIISHSQTPLDVLQVYGLFLAAGWEAGGISVDIVPLFETVEDLQNAAGVMWKLYENEDYREHLRKRGDRQTVMVGFSDGTKDGGYLMANYGIFAAKRALTEVSRDFGIDVVFFDGRGGPPARGGGKTHRFYASMGSDISNTAFEVTVQGQTVSSNFGTVDAARYNIEQMVHAGTYPNVVLKPEPTFTEEEEELFRSLAETSFEAYSALKNDDDFLDYLANATPLNYYARANIGSRPSKRGGQDAKLTLDSLRAIPFVGAWYQMKQNVPGFYGLGYALSSAASEGRLDDVKALYRKNQFFKALIDNSEMAMQKTYLPLTAHLENDDEFGRVWRRIRDEYERTSRYLTEVTESQGLMKDSPVAAQSVRLREKIVLPLSTIQQYALEKIRRSDGDWREAYEKLVVRCSFGIINAGRNSA